jgi:integrase
MKGHIRERSRGRWAIILDARDPMTGRRKRRWHSFAGTKRQAQIECARLIAEQQNGTNVEPNKITVAEFLNRWLDHMQTQVSPSSHSTYSTMLRCYAFPPLGALRLNKLGSADIANAYTTVMQGGLRRRLIPKSVHLLHRILSQALKQAIKWNLLKSNPAATVAPPRVERRQMTTPDPDATLALIEAARSTELFPVILLAAMTGMRRGEIAALRWRSIDLDGGQLAVIASTEQVRRSAREKPPKSGRARTLALPAVLIEELRRYRLHQAERLLKLGVRQTEVTHVCLRADGTAWLPSLMSAAFLRLLKANGLSRMRLHDLRHAHATHLLRANIHPKVVQERLARSRQHRDDTRPVQPRCARVAERSSGGGGYHDAGRDQAANGSKAVASDDFRF